jgi:hypothetical protein
MNTREKLEELRENHDLTSSRRQLAKYFLISIFLVVGTGALFYAMNSSKIQPEQQQPEIDGETVDVVIDNVRATPSRPTISRDDGIRFVNNASHTLNFTFERNIESFTLEQGGTKVVDINEIVYYDVNAVGEVEFREISAGINVQ